MMLPISDQKLISLFRMWCEHHHNVNPYNLKSQEAFSEWLFEQEKNISLNDLEIANSLHSIIDKVVL